MDDWKSLELFEREAEVLRSLDHPMIPSYVHAFHTESTGGGRRFYIAQDFVDGMDLEKRMEQGERWDESRALLLAMSVLEALEYLHSLTPAVIHRDIKPSNLIERSDGSIALVDFGAVQNVLPKTVGGSTIVGTIGYMPFEQVSGRSTAASDLYALGATLIHLVTRTPPVELMSDHARIQFRSRGSLTARCERFLAKLVEPMPADRFASASAAAARLRADFPGLFPPPDPEPVAPPDPEPVAWSEPEPEAAATPPGKPESAPKVIEKPAARQSPQLPIPVGRAPRAPTSQLPQTVEPRPIPLGKSGIEFGVLRSYLTEEGARLGWLQLQHGPSWVELRVHGHATGMLSVRFSPGALRTRQTWRFTSPDRVMGAALMVLVTLTAVGMMWSAALWVAAPIVLAAIGAMAPGQLAGTSLEVDGGRFVWTNVEGRRLSGALSDLTNVVANGGTVAIVAEQRAWTVGAGLTAWQASWLARLIAGHLDASRGPSLRALLK